MSSAPQAIRFTREYSWLSRASVDGGPVTLTRAVRVSLDRAICLQHIAQSAYDGPTHFLKTASDLMACAYELVPIDFECRAWVSTVMAGKSMNDYLDAWFPDGVYKTLQSG